MKHYRIFTIDCNRVSPGATVRWVTIAGGTVQLPAIVLGERGRGRRQTYVPVWYEAGRPAPDAELEPVTLAALGKTRAGHPKLVVPANPVEPADDAALIIQLTPHGYRGGANHTGDRARVVKGAGWGGRDRIEFHDFPGEILARGVIADGLAGRMASSEQFLALVPAGVVFRVGRSGRLYGAPNHHYYVFDAASAAVLTATWEERVMLPDDHPLAAPVVPVE